MIRYVLAWAFQPIVALVGVALLLAVALAALPSLWAWWVNQLPHGVPAAGVVLFGIALVAAVLSSRGSS